MILNHKTNIRNFFKESIDFKKHQIKPMKRSLINVMDQFIMIIFFILYFLKYKD
jgi:hypothetical protein